MEQLKGLVDLFQTNIKQYTSNAYDEANTRVDFIDKFFELLGWDVANRQWYSENYREVVREDKVKVQWKTKAPDYSFRLWGKRIFFVEAKKPWVDIKHDTDPAFQIRRYSWTAKLSLGILTDFEELAIYDTRIKPNINDKADNARIFYCRFDEFEKNRDFIYNTFSKEAVLKWSFDKYVQETKKKWTSEVDKEFLKLIDGRREDIAKNAYLRNKEIFENNIPWLNGIVQNLIDKIIFLRIAEDRDIEEYAKLQEICKLKTIDWSVYKQLLDYFSYADNKYNSNLFKVDELMKTITIDDKIIKEIVNSLYYPVSPYEFSVLEVDILGNIYEQFLWKTVELSWRTLKIEEKPEVKKAWWVFYTPQYIVDYIVQNTVGKTLKWKSINDALKLKIVDPACGSWAFLVWAFTYLLNWYLEQYSKEENLQKAKSGNKIFSYGDSYHLTLQTKKEILISNIHGVDIDAQAVEVSKLSLLLKLLEWETRETAASNKLFSGVDSKILPKLEDNIKCGNSLIWIDYWNNQTDISDQMIKKINAFDREKNFPKIFENWGFDVVIGNPPYVQVLHSESDNQIKYFQSNYSWADAFKKNLFPLFLEKSIKILKQKNGFSSMIIPDRYFFTPSYIESRKFIVENAQILQVDEILEGAFENAIVGNAIFVLTTPSSKKYSVEIKKMNNWVFETTNHLWKEEIAKSNYEINLLLDSKTKSFWDKIYKNNTPLKDFLNLHVGIMIKDKNNVFHKEIIPWDNEKIIVWRDFSRYFLKEISHFNLEKAIVFWWTKNPIKHKTNPKLFIRKTGNAIISCLDEEWIFAEQSVYLWLLKGSSYNLKYFLWLLNSKFMTFFFQSFLITNPLAYPYIQHYDLEKLPIPQIDFSNLQQKQQHDQLINLVDQMLVTQKQHHQALSEWDKTLYQQKIEILDKQIDNLVFDLYGLSKEERKVVLDR